MKEKLRGLTLNKKYYPWITLVLGIYVMTTSGSLYFFGAWSEPLRRTEGWSVENIGNIGTMLHFGVWASFVGGLLYDKFGHRPVAIGGSLLIFVGYFFLYLIKAQIINVPYWLAGIFAFSLGQGSSMCYFVALNPSIKNFKSEHRGKVVGVLVCCFALCSGIYTQFYLSLIHI
eukprot:TRINITY_DN4858_c0_g1_i4.p1 TRINITY_DN4858_c0_g1~~TRINITY_DN4858_c0_g1_i4.p1  ORF type:complete len:173 (-),score=19.80 TRINITY_DN4858_c0_g1_i4:23-541(-)